MTDEQRDKVEANHALAIWGAKRLLREKGRRITAAEAKTIAEDALITAVRYHDPARGKLSTIFMKALRSESWRSDRWGRQLGYRYLEAPEGPKVFRWSAVKIGVMFTAKAAAITPEERLDLPDVLAAVGKLDDRRRDILESHAIRGETLKSIGDRHGIGKERVRQLYGDAIIRVRKILGVD